MNKIPWNILFGNLTAITMTIIIGKLTVFFNKPSIMWWFIVPLIIVSEYHDGKGGAE